jgi:peptide/nickel transport system ATP-binding protein
MEEPARSVLLDVRGLRVSFRFEGKARRAVDDVSFSLSRGETLALVGESGCGKSALALALLRLIPVEGGQVRYGGRNLLALTEREMRGIRGKEIAMVFQEPMTSLNPVLTVGNQIEEAVRLHGTSGDRSPKEAALAALEQVGIPAARDRFGSYPHQMSGGMRQRVMIAMALAGRPSILIADEPTTALDVTIQAQILDLISRLQADARMAVLFITHDLGVVAETAHRVAVMYAGQVVEEAPVRELMSRPLHPYTEALRRSIPRAGGPGSRLESIPGRVPSLSQVPPWCRFYERCARAEAECRESCPELREIGPGRRVRCRRV